MFGQFYERKRNTGLTNKPVVEKIFALKHEVDAKGKAIKLLFLTDEEMDDLKQEFIKLKDELKTYKSGAEQAAIAAFFGVPIEILNEIGNEKVDNVA